MAKKYLLSVAMLAAICAPSALGAENVNIEFKQIRGPKPQAPLVVQDADLTPVTQKQLDRILAEGGMLDIGMFKQSPGMNMKSSVYAIKMKINGKSHECEIDELSAPPAYAKLVHLILKCGHKPVQAASADTAPAVDTVETANAKTADVKPADAQSKGTPLPDDKGK
jgi:hypothetical protein